MLNPLSLSRSLSRRWLALALTTCAACAHAQTPWGTHTSGFQINTPVYSYSQSTTYPGGQAQFDAAYSARVRDLNAGRNFYNDVNGQTRSTSSTHTYGGTWAGFGASHSTTSVPVTRSAAEDALHMYNRTAHLRRISEAAGSG